MQAPTDKQFREAAMKIHPNADEVRVPDHPRIRHNGVDGAWVAAWVWVPDEEAAKEATR